MPSLKSQVVDEYLKFKELKDTNQTSRVEQYIRDTSSLISEVAHLMIDFCNTHKIDVETTGELAEYMKDTAIAEGLAASGGDFTNIEDYVLVSKNKSFSTYKTLFTLDMEFAPEKVIDYIKSPNSSTELDSEETIRWLRMLVQYFGNGTDNEDEQLQKGSNKRKNNN